MTEPLRCAWCYAVLTPGGKGRPRRYCSVSCRVRCWRGRRSLARHEIAIERLIDAARRRSEAALAGETA